MQQKTYASTIFTSQILTDSYAGRDNTSSGPQNRAVIAVIRTLSKLNTAFTGPQYGLYKISMDLIGTLCRLYQNEILTIDLL